MIVQIIRTLKIHIRKFTIKFEIFGILIVSQNSLSNFENFPIFEIQQFQKFDYFMSL